MLSSSIHSQCIRNGVQAVKLCSDVIFKLLTGSASEHRYNGRKIVVAAAAAAAACR